LSYKNGVLGSRKKIGSLHDVIVFTCVNVWMIIGILRPKERLKNNYRMCRFLLEQVNKAMALDNDQSGHT
jgi:hypothetical protein